MRKLLVLGIAAIALIAFSGLASGSVYVQSWSVGNSTGWSTSAGPPGYELHGRYSYNDHQQWKEIDGTVYIPSHNNWHINWDCKVTYGGKLVTITHYNFMYQLWFGPRGEGAGAMADQVMFYMGYLHIVDIKDDAPINYYCWYPGLTPAITKFKINPTISDTTELWSYIFNEIPFELIPLIDRMEFYSNAGVLTIDVGVL